MTARDTPYGARLTPKQRVLRRHRTAYCKKHHDCDMWCVFLRRDDDVARVCAFTVYQAWTRAYDLRNHQ